MSSAISWNLQLAVQEGHMDAARTLMSDMVEATRRESGALGYEWFIDAAGSACDIRERYADSDAALEHLGNFKAHFAERFMECFAPTSLHVYGEPSAALREVLDGFGAEYLGPFGGFTR